MDDIVGTATPLGFTMCALGGDDEHLCIASAEELALVAQAELEAAWRKAMEEELHVIE
jgi:hypothetical protein